MKRGWIIISGLLMISFYGVVGFATEKKNTESLQLKDNLVVETVDKKSSKNTFNGKKDLELSLKTALEKALINSSKVKMQKNNIETSRENAEAVSSRRFPTLSIEGNYRYQEEINEITMPPPINQTLSLGDHNNFSLGPTIKWLVWDGNQLTHLYKSLKLVEKAMDRQLDVQKRQTTLETRVLYYKVLFHIQQQRLVWDSLQLARSQYKDINNRARYGSSSRADLLLAKQEVLDLQRSFYQAQSELLTQLRELYFLIGENQEDIGSFPNGFSDEQIKIKDELIQIQVDQKINFDSLEESLKSTQNYLLSPLKESENPFVGVWEYQYQASLKKVEKIKGSHWPQLTFQAKSSIEYPSVPDLEQFQQTSWMLSLNFPIFEWGRVLHEEKAEKAQAMIFEEQKEYAIQNYSKERHSVENQMSSLEKQRELSQSIVKEAEELSRLTYDTFKAGRIGFLEVQRANLKVYSARLQLASAEVQYLIQWAKLYSLSEERGNEK